MQHKCLLYLFRFEPEGFLKMACTFVCSDRFHRLSVDQYGEPTDRTRGRTLTVQKEWYLEQVLCRTKFYPVTFRKTALEPLAHSNIGLAHTMVAVETE